MLQVESPLRNKYFFIKKVCLKAKKSKKKLKLVILIQLGIYSWAPEIALGIYYFSQSNIKDIILSSGVGLSGIQILDMAYHFKNLKFKKFLSNK